MAHLKVWFCLLIALALAAFVPQLQTKLGEQIDKREYRLVAVKKHRIFQKNVHQFYEKTKTDLSRMARHKSIAVLLSSLPTKTRRKRRRRRRKKRVSLKKLNQGIQQITFLRNIKSPKRLYIFTASGSLVYRSDKPDTTRSSTHPLSQIPMLNTPKNVPGAGVWFDGNKPIIAIGVPIFNGKRNRIGSMLMTYQVNRNLFYEIGFNPDDDKGDAVILFSEQDPLAYGISNSRLVPFKKWFSQNYPNIIRTFQKGFYLSETPHSFVGTAHHHTIDVFPGALNSGRVGFILFSAANTKTIQAPLRQKSVMWGALGAGAFALLLALWFSLGYAGQIGKLNKLAAQYAAAPEKQITSKEYPGPYRKVGRSLEEVQKKFVAQQNQQASFSIEEKPAPPKSKERAPEKKAPVIQEPSTNAPIPSPIAAPAPTPAPAPSLSPLPDVGAPAKTPMPSPSPLQKAPSTPLPTMPPLTPVPDSPPQPPVSGLGLSPLSNIPPAPPPNHHISSEAETGKFTVASIDGVVDPSSLLPEGESHPQKNKPPVGDELEDAFAKLGDDESKKTLIYSSMTEEEAKQHLTDSVQEQFKIVFDEYKKKRKECGESTSNLKFESFVEKLKKQRETIISQFGCQDVKFHVYEKGGRAAIKATPVK